MTAQELYEALDKTGIPYTVAESFEGIRVINFPIDEPSENRTEMVAALVRKELDWLVENPTEENIQDATFFFSQGGFDNYSDQDIKEQFDMTEEA
jgi:hypothetical protein